MRSPHEPGEDGRSDGDNAGGHSKELHSSLFYETDRGSPNRSFREKPKCPIAELPLYMLQWTYVVSKQLDGGEMVAGTGDAVHGGEPVRRPSKSACGGWKRTWKNCESRYEPTRRRKRKCGLSQRRKTGHVWKRPRKLLARQRLPPKSAPRKEKSPPPSPKPPAIPCGTGVETSGKGDRS